MIVYIILYDRYSRIIYQPSASITYIQFFIVSQVDAFLYQKGNLDDIR